MDEKKPLVGSAKYNGVERRRHERVDVFLNGNLRTATTFTPCRVYNISVAGAFIEVNVVLRVGERILLELPGSAGVTGRVVRIDSNKAGIAFETAKAAMEADMGHSPSIKRATLTGNRSNEFHQGQRSSSRTERLDP